jgi:hypothetical protein
MIDQRLQILIYKYLASKIIEITVFIKISDLLFSMD